MDHYLLLGIVGMCMLLFTFLMSQTQKMSQNDLKYDALNALGALLLVIYGIHGEAWPFVILNTVWGVYSLKDVILGLKNRSPSRRS